MRFGEWDGFKAERPKTGLCRKLLTFFVGKIFPLSGKHLRTFHRPLSPFAGGAEGAEKNLRSRTAWGSMSVEPSKLVPPEAKRPTFNLQMLHDGQLHLPGELLRAGP